jgi:hypothetical protein
MKHNDVIKTVPKKMRHQFLVDLQKSPIESHYGIKDKWFYLTLMASALVPIILALVFA